MTRFRTDTLMVNWFRPAGGTLILSLLWPVLVMAAPLDTTADAVLGQADMTSAIFNAPDGATTAAGLALSNAAHLAIAPSGRLYLSDCENHRVLSWPSAGSFSDNEAADLVIGQPDFASGAPNRGGTVSADSFSLPQGLAVDASGALWVADAFNSRVLKFENPASSDGVADLVIGQPDFTSNAGNLGQGAGPPDIAAQDSILFPGRVSVRGSDVWVVDSGNSRVLHYTAPTTNKPFADLVLGQYNDFTGRAKNNDGSNQDFGVPTADNMFNPIGMTIDRRGGIYVADWQNHRLLYFQNPLNADTTADRVIAQPDFTSGTPNVAGPGTGLHLPIDLAFDVDGRLLVADSGNHRILAFDKPAIAEYLQPADAVFGQLGSFTGKSLNHGLAPPITDADGLSGPTGLASIWNGYLFVVDTNNQRVLRFDQPLPRLVPGDFDRDGDVDRTDADLLFSCLSGPGVRVAMSCETALVDDDDDADLADVSLLLQCFSGDGVMADPDCGH